MPVVFAKKKLEEILAEYEMQVLGWRDVPVNNKILGQAPLKTEPRIRQCFVGMRSDFYRRDDFNRRLYLIRQRTENEIEFGKDMPKECDDFYICLMSTNRMVYKGMLTPDQVRAYFPDLSDPDFSSPYAIVHSRFSTNTFPSWRLAQSVPLFGTQRRNQHAAWQPQLDACPNGFFAI